MRHTLRRDVFSFRRFLGLSSLVGILASLLVLLPSPGQAAPGDIGFEDQSFSGTGTPTGTKRAESVLWWNDGSWWANMWDTVSQDFHIFRLNTATQAWQDTGVTVDTRSNTHADVLWDGTHLYVASHQFIPDEQPAVSGFPGYLFRFSYNPVTKGYSRDSGFPVQINNMRTETLVIDKDSTGKIWATWQQDNKIYLNTTNGDDRVWGVPFPLPDPAVNVTVDDNSSVIAFGGNKIGLMWSNQSGSNYAMWFAFHQDGASDTAWSAGERALQGPSEADDHINLKSLQADGSGRVFAATKTSNTSSASALIMLAVRSTSGVWSRHPIAQVSDCPNRPLVLIDEQNNVLHTFYTAPAPPNYTCTSSGGAIYKKTSPLNSVSFTPGRGTPVILDADSPFVHDASSTKQNVNSSTGIVVLATNGPTARYWHHYETLGGPPPPSEPPVANFTGSPTNGITPLTVNFSDNSTGAPTSWAWTFGDGGTSTAQNPSHVYTVAGTYSVTLQATNSLGSNTVTKSSYITVTPPPPDFTVSVSPARRTIQRGSSTTYAITVTPLHEFTGQVTLSVSGLPSGTTASFSPNPVNGSAPASSTLFVTTSSTMKQGSNNFTIRATSGALSHTAVASLQVKK